MTWPAVAYAHHKATALSYSVYLSLFLFLKLCRVEKYRRLVLCVRLALALTTAARIGLGNASLSGPAVDWHLSAELPEFLRCVAQRQERRVVADLPNAEVERKYDGVVIIRYLTSIG
jgi:hypothetical protein